jgi:hypothetical protein
MYRLFLAFAVVSGCTVSNPLFNSNEDLAGGGDLAGADLTGADLSGDVDLSASKDDLSGPPPDLRMVLDLRRSDMPIVTTDMAGCGLPGQKCCVAGDACVGGGCCNSGVCVAAGDDCAGTVIPTVCKAGTCVTCGITGMECCAAHTCSSGCCSLANTCVAVTQPCGGNTGICQGDGSCKDSNGNSSCGTDNLMCCASQPINTCTSSHLVCARNSGVSGPGVCRPCGYDGQDCCDGNACNDGGCCVLGTCQKNGDSCGSTTCVNGSCGGGTCGGIGQPCCQTGPGFNVCTQEYTTCAGGPTCELCGGLNQRCCWDWRTSQYTWCAKPYKANSMGGGSCTCQP